MGFNIPRVGTKEREAMGDISHVAEILNPKNIAELRTLREGLNSAKASLKSLPRGSRVNIIILRANGERHLISVSQNGKWYVLWNFGDGSAARA